MSNQFDLIDTSIQFNLGLNLYKSDLLAQLKVWIRGRGGGVTNTLVAWGMFTHDLLFKTPATDLDTRASDLQQSLFRENFKFIDAVVF